MSVKEKSRQLFLVVIPLVIALVVIPLVIAWFVYRYPIIGKVFAAMVIVIGIVMVMVVALTIVGAKMPVKERLQTLLLLIIFLVIAWSLYRYPITRAVFAALAAAIGIGATYLLVYENKVRQRLLADLNSEDESAREKAVISLTEDLATVDDLAAAFARERSAHVRRVIVETLHAMSRAYFKRDYQKAEYEKSHPSRGAPLTLDLPGYAHVLEKYVMPPLIAAMQSTDREEREAAVLALLWIGTEDAMKAIASSPHHATPPPVLAPSPEDAQFTAYYPDMTNPEVDNTLYVYAYVRRMLSQVHRDVMESGETSRGGAPVSQTAKRSLGLPKETPITITPECEHVEFVPSSITQKWNGGWMRFRFTYKTQAPPGSDQLAIRVSIRVLAMEIANIECTTKVMRREAGDRPEVSAGVNPLAAAKFDSHTSVPYQGIFVSYSRKDAKVVRMYRLVQEAVGNDVFMDTYSIRAGENWEAALANAIDTADIFQLFWSENSAKSSSVRNEWDYALNHRYPETRCVGFIRPVYWSLPMPAPPGELKHLNFKFVPLLEEERTEIKRISRSRHWVRH
jgi:hypothetical protein